MVQRLILFLLLNFAALGLGAYLMDSGPVTEWYQELNKAPWTPPGWFLGLAWTTIMICFAIYMAALWGKTAFKKTLALEFALQWVLNVLWNPVFFKFHHPQAGLIVIIALTLLMGYMLLKYRPQQWLQSLLIWPYLLWLCVATSLNAYIVWCN